MDFTAYENRRPIRSAVEREFILIGEAVASIRRVETAVADGISHARMIVGFRNLLTHDYAAVDDDTVFGVATEDLPVLRAECAALLKGLGGAG